MSFSANGICLNFQTKIFFNKFKIYEKAPLNFCYYFSYSFCSIS